MKEFNQDSFKSEVLEQEGLVVVDFWAPWCGPCRMLAPIFEEVSQKFDNVVFGKVNVDENQDLAAELGIMGIPTIIIYKNGEKVDQITGFIDSEGLANTIKKHLT